MFRSDRPRLTLSRRELLKSTTALAALGLAPGLARGAMDGPWAAVPGSKVDAVNFTGWQYGEIYAKIAQQFQNDWGVEFKQNLSGFNEYFQKFTTAFAGGAQIDCAMGFAAEIRTWAEQGIVEPLDDLPGLDQYVADFTPAQKQISQFEGSVWALPYFSTIWVWNYYEDMLEKAGFDHAFTSYDELIEQCVKAKKDGVCQYPILWVAGVGPEQLPGTWYSMTWNRGGTFFDAQGNHQLGPGSVARETLRWWAETFTKLDIADPESLKVQFTGSAKAFMAGHNLYRGPNHHYGLNLVNDPGQSPIAGKVKMHPMPGDGRTMANGGVYFMTTAHADKEWAWKTLQYLGGRTKDGEYTQAYRLASDAMLGSGYQSVMDSPKLSETWSKWGDVPAILSAWQKATFMGDVISSVFQKWHTPWNDIINIELQKTLTGQKTADEACDTMIEGIATAKRSI
ncbi:MAG: extracellular solute-binding protein [Ectothiorhodospiraceae bacterium]|nr:extracellular solute-binding protein [Ectothiorhodospiraceae bacterium]